MKCNSLSLNTACCCMCVSQFKTTALFMRKEDMSRKFMSEHPSQQHVLTHYLCLHPSLDEDVEPF